MRGCFKPRKPKRRFSEPGRRGCSPRKAFKAIAPIAKGLRFMAFR